MITKKNLAVGNMEMSEDLFNRRLVTLKVESYVKETEKAFLVRIDGMKRWIPKSVSNLNPNWTEITVQGWFVDKMNKGGTLFSDDDKHRYVLWETWDETKKRALCIGLNPSTAQTKSDKNDTTINRLTGVLIELGYGGLRMVNLYTIISADPAILLDPSLKGDAALDIGIIFTNAILCQDVIFCWGTFPEAKDRSKPVIDLFPNAFCFGKNQDGSPWHPRALHYAGLKAEAVRIFSFADHKYENNRYSDKSKRKRAVFNQKQYSLLKPII